MKFGKNIGRVVELSDPEWSPFWVNYKFLKKKAKALEVPSKRLRAASPDQRSNPEAIARSAGEVEFYKLLRQELRKCADFFTEVEAQLMVRQARVNEGWRQLLLPNIIVEGNPNKRLMAACVKLYKDLLLLENFAIMNYCGFSKILKKHDKLTGFLTRESFMKNVVNQAPFVQYPRVIKMLSAVEVLFNNIESLPSASAEVGTRVPLREEQLFIDTMLTINTEAFRLQQEEGADIGLNTPEFTHKRDCFSLKALRLKTGSSNGGAVAGSSSSRGGRGGRDGGRGSGGGSGSGRGGGGGCGGSSNNSSVPQSNGRARRGLEIVAAAAAQGISRDSEKGGSPPPPPLSVAAPDVAPADAAAEVVADELTVRLPSPSGEASSTAAAATAAEAEEEATAAAAAGAVVAERTQTLNSQAGTRAPSARNGQHERGGDDRTSPPLSKRLRPDIRGSNERL